MVLDEFEQTSKYLKFTFPHETAPGFLWFSISQGILRYEMEKEAKYFKILEKWKIWISLLEMFHLHMHRTVRLERLNYFQSYVYFK